MLSVAAAVYAQQASLSKYDKLKYADVDCQAFCELVLKDCGVRMPSGAVWNWKGSNDMARNAVAWIGTKEECIKTFGEIPVGAWAFMWDNTGNEKKRGYYDGKGNYSHIGIYIGQDKVRDSTKIKNSQGQIIRDGVGTRSLKDFQIIGLAKVIDFAGTKNIMEVDKKDVEKIKQLLSEAESIIKGWG